jgi:hypothetical protein
MTQRTKRIIDFAAIAVFLLLFTGGLYIMWDEFVAGIQMLSDILFGR